jgi:hypothetical protein
MRRRLLFFGELCGLLALLILALPAAAQETTGRICVTAFHDSNQNRMRDSIEPLLAGVVVNLQDAQAVVVASYLTDGRSEPHCFTDLAPGTYTVTFEGGTHTPTGQTAFGVLVGAGQTAQAHFGALPATVVTTAQAATAAPVDNTTLRLALSCAGAICVMLLMLGFGAIIYWLRYK